MPGKWGLHTFYARTPSIARLLPATKLLSPASLRNMMNRYGSVYVKPNMEHTGKGILKAWRSSDGYKVVKVRGPARTFESMDGLVKHIMQAAGRKPHIVQQTIRLAMLNGRRYDIRVMMMRDKQDKWRYTAMLAKVAGPASIITNVRRGKGYATTVEHAVKRSLQATDKTFQQLQHQLINTSYAVCRRFQAYKYSSQIGIDYGVDEKGRLWLIEVNFDYPSHALFNLLPDKTAYKRIKRIRAAYKSRNIRKKA